MPVVRLLFLSGIVFLLVFFSMMPSAQAAALNWTADENIALSDPAITMTILETSVSDVVTVRTNQIAVTMPANGRFLLQSPRQLTVGGASSQASIGFLCRAGFITELDFRSGSEIQNITITPQSGTCGGGGGGGSGGSGGGGGGASGVSLAPPAPVAPAVPAKPAVPATPAVPVPQLAQILKAQPVTQIHQKITPQKIAVVTPGFTFKKFLKRGSRGKEVIELQKLLVANGFLIMPLKIPYGFLGKSTENAIKLFQEEHGIVTKGKAGYGLIGPKTRKILNQLLLY